MLSLPHDDVWLSNLDVIRRFLTVDSNRSALRTFALGKRN